ncbi:MAG: UvrD-helicase domain-containing protein [Actinobacteria bacterium]|nr:UvrD-helicase domain-containing protein [Actinomycetota bacterium]MCL5446978.1 UvrD-helicase domain-containing protein [Actinomycetota bacterium]
MERMQDGMLGGVDIESIKAEDQAARSRITTDIERVLFVEAGAGTGKTTALVCRVVSVAQAINTRCDNRQDLPEHIVAITFTEAAAQELGERIRYALARAGIRDDLVIACTIHSFAARLLREHGTLKLLPVGFEIMDAIAETAYLAEVWKRALAEMLADARSAKVLSICMAMGATLMHLRDTYMKFQENWDRLEMFREPAWSDHNAASELDLERDLMTLLKPKIGSLLTMLDGLVSRANRECKSQDDVLYRYIIDTLMPVGTNVRLALEKEDAEGVLETLRSCAFRTESRKGRKDSWVDIGEIRGSCRAIREGVAGLLADAGHLIGLALLGMFSTYTVDQASKRVTQGKVTFHDLLVLARDLLRDDPEVRAKISAEYTYIFVDEFQDTDPIQAEIIGYIVSSHDDCDLLAARSGSLFVVGDPRQSIYRFRRADVELYRSLAGSADQVRLQVNFRSRPGILEVINSLFANIFTDQRLHSSLVPSRDAVIADQTLDMPVSHTAAGDEDAGTGNATGATGATGSGAATAIFSPPQVLTVGGLIENARSDEIRDQAADDVASSIRDMVRDRWPVEDRNGQVRPIRFRDIAILVPTRTSVEAIEESLSEYNIPYHLEGVGYMWRSDEIFDILSVLRAVASPYDAQAVVAALRSPLLGCSDQDVYLWHKRGGDWSLDEEPEEVAGRGGRVGTADPDTDIQDVSGQVGHGGAYEDPVLRGKRVLRELVDLSQHESVSSMVRCILFDYGGMEVYMDTTRWRDSLALLRWFLVQAVWFDDDGEGSLTDFIQFMDDQISMEESAPARLPQDDDDDAVRIMTVHGAKGLEFGAVFVAGIDRDVTRGRRSPHLLFDSFGKVELKVGDAKTSGYDDMDNADKMADLAESSRLLYVACTRARDYLVLVLHHGVGSSPDTCHAALLDAWFKENPQFGYEWPVAIYDESAIRNLSGEGCYGTSNSRLPFSKIAASWEHGREKLSARVGSSLWRTSKATDVEQEYRRLTQGQHGFSQSAVDRHAADATADATAATSCSELDQDSRVQPGSPPISPAGDDRNAAHVPSPSVHADASHARRETSLAIGNAVHNLLKQLDLRSAVEAFTDADMSRHDATGHGDHSGRVRQEIEALARRIATSYHVAGYADKVARMALVALESDTVRKVMRCRYAQEVPVVAPLESFLRATRAGREFIRAGEPGVAAGVFLSGAGVAANGAVGAGNVESTDPDSGTWMEHRQDFIGLHTMGVSTGTLGAEGVVDLLIEGGDGLIVVDFKTEARDAGSFKTEAREPEASRDAREIREIRDAKEIREIREIREINRHEDQEAAPPCRDGAKSETPLPRGIERASWPLHNAGGQHGSPVFAEYVLQLAFYAGALEAVTKRPVTSCVVAYLGGPTPVEHVIAGTELSEAMRMAGEIAWRLISQECGSQQV